MIAATHRDLQSMIRNNHFREDLFYRLNVFPIEIPPLRERRDDIPLLVNYFVSTLSRRMGKQIESIPEEVMEVLSNHTWRGNVRELANFIERAVILSQGDELQVPIAELNASHARGFAPASTFEKAERNVIIDALKSASGQISGKSNNRRRNRRLPPLTQPGNNFRSCLKRNHATAVRSRGSPMTPAASAKTAQRPVKIPGFSCGCQLLKYVLDVNAARETFRSFTNQNT